MILKDDIYGESEIKEPVLIEIIESPELQRLKDISQFGVPQEWYIFPDFSRYEHSVGVMILLKNLGASLDEQIAGLTHDISHTAFSHVVDWVYGTNTTEKFQDNNHQAYFEKSSLKDIVKNHGFNSKRIVNHKNFSLLERDIPDLCADRVDYCLRELDSWMNHPKLNDVLKSITTHNYQIVFKDYSSAKIFGESFLRCQNEHWGALDTMVRFHLLAQALKTGLEIGIIDKEDFWTTDREILRKLESSKNKDVINHLRLLADGFGFHRDTTNPEVVLNKKFRYVDPSYFKNGKLIKLSSIDSSYRSLIEKSRQANVEGAKGRIIPRIKYY
jgi:uncharacterized protein